MRIKLNIQRFAEDGKVVIDVVANTKTAEKDIDRLYNRLRELEAKDTHEIEWNGVKITGLSSLSDEELKEYDEISAKINEIKSAEAERLHEERLASLELEKQQEAIEKANNKINEWVGNTMTLSNGLKLVRKNAENIDEQFKKTNINIKGVGNKISGIVKKVGKWALALLGIRTVLSILSRSFSTLTQYNTELGEKVENMRLLLATAFEPIITWLVNMAERLLSVIGTIYKTLFGVDLYARAGALSANKMAKGYSGASKSAKDLKKQLAGFDEMNVLQDTTEASTGGGGGAGSSNHVFNLTPNLKPIDLDTIITWVKDFVDKLIKWINETIANIDPKQLANGISKLIVGLIDIVNKTFTDINWGELVSKLIQTIMALDWPSIIGGLLENIIITSFIFPIELLLGIIDGILTGIINFIEDPTQWDGAGKEIIEGLWEGLKKAISKIWELFKSIIEKFKQIFGIHSPSTVFMDFGKMIIEGLVNGIKALLNMVTTIFKGIVTTIKSILGVIGDWIYNHVIAPVINYFRNMWDTLTTGFTNIWNKIKEIFNNIKNFISGIITNVISLFKNIGTKVGDAIGGAFKNAINSVLGAVEKILNSPIRSINSLLTKINKVPGINIKKLSTFSFPRLAKGGIINQPGRGVMVGNAIVGERGAEGVIPLTDSQQMALLGEAIGKYITINANITNSMNGRVISRELQKIQNERNFSYNS